MLPDPNCNSEAPSITAPLRVPAFRAIWAANTVSNVGTLIQGVGAAWLMVSLTPSTLFAGLIQTSGTLPVFLVGLVAGALADLADRKKLLFWAQSWMMLMAAALGILTLIGLTTPWTLLGFTFAIGLGAAVSLPAWQAAIQDIVPKAWVASAVSLNSISFNVARAAGPAMGGILVAVAGAAFAFLANALSYVGVLLAILHWKPEPRETPPMQEDISGAIRSGLRYLWHSPRLQGPIIRSMTFNLCAGAVWALLPLLARDVLKTTATGYGLLLAAFGAGSITAALILPRLRDRYHLDRILFLGVVIAAAAFLGVSQSRQLWQASLCLYFCGLTWVGVLVNFNVAVQTSAPDWVRGRAIAFYLLAFQGILALNGALWGWMAGVVGISSCFAVAAAGLLLGLLLIRVFPLSADTKIDLRPAPSWPEPDTSLKVIPKDSPVLVAIEYEIQPSDEILFRRLMRRLRSLRLRDGAERWRLYRKGSHPEQFLEIFRLQSWEDYLLQHQRGIMEDRRIEDRIISLHRGPEPPRVSHYFGIEE